MAYGFDSWDASGVSNNTGLASFFQVGVMEIKGTGAATVSQTFTVPSGYKLSYFILAGSAVNGGQGEAAYSYRVTISGGTVTLNRVALGSAPFNGYLLRIAVSVIRA